MSTLTLAQSDNIPSTPPHSRSPSPKRNFRSENSDNHRGRPRQHPPVLRKQFQGFQQYSGNFRPCSSQMVKIHSEQIQDLDHFLDPDQGPDPSIIHNKYNAITVTIWGIQQTIAF